MRKCYACDNETGDSLYCLHCGALQKCLNCNHIFETDSKFCGECGTEKGKKAQQQEHSSKEQPSIHNENQSVAHDSTATAVNQSPNGVAPVNEASTQQSDNKSSNVKWVIGIVAVIAVAAALYFFVFNKAQGTPEETVENFIYAMDKQNKEKMEELIRPSNREELMKDVDFRDMPADTRFEFLRTGEVDFESDSIAYVEADVKVSSEIEEESDSIYFDFELLKIKNKWYIVDIY